MTARSASEAALLLRVAIGTPAAERLKAAEMLNSWASLQRAVVSLSERDPRVVDVLRSFGGAS